MGSKTPQKLQKLQRRKAPSPVARIPAEILSEILLLSTTIPLLPAGAQRAENYICTLCHVSPFWRSVALSSSKLWIDIDIKPTTKAKRLKFIFKRAKPMPISLHVDLGGDPESSPRNQPVRALKTAVRLIYEAELSSLVFKGSITELGKLIPVFPNGPSLRTVIISVPVQTEDDWIREGHGFRRYVARAKCPQLRSLVVSGCAFDPTSGILRGASCLTNAALLLPPNTSGTELAEALRQLPRLQTLTLGLSYPLQSHGSDGAAINPVRLPFLAHLSASGNFKSTTALLSLLRIPTALLTLHLLCDIPHGENPVGIGGEVFNAIGQMRSLNGYSTDGTTLLNVTVGTYNPMSQGYHFIGIGEMVKGEGSPFLSLRSTIVCLCLRDGWTGLALDCAVWLPMVVLSDMNHLQTPIYWSVTQLEVVTTRGAVHIPSAFWERISACPALKSITTSVKDVRNLLPFLSRGHDSICNQDRPDVLEDEDGVLQVAVVPKLPFPSLRSIEVHPSYFGPHGTERNCNSILEVFIGALQQRRELVMAHPNGGQIMTMGLLTFMDCDSAPSKTLVATLSTLVYRVEWIRRAWCRPFPTATLAPVLHEESAALDSPQSSDGSEDSEEEGGEEEEEEC